MCVVNMFACAETYAVINAQMYAFVWKYFPGRGSSLLFIEARSLGEPEAH